MKRLPLFVLLLCVGAAVPAFAELRFDLGADFLFVGMDGSSSGDMSSVNGFFLPAPGYSLLLQFNTENLHFGFGGRAFSYLFATVAWPVVYAELDLGRFTLHGSVGGRYFGYLGPSFSAVAYDDLVYESALSSEDDSYVYAECGTGDLTSSAAMTALGFSFPLYMADLSAWLRIGNYFRIGAGALILFTTDEEIAFEQGPVALFYTGLKWSFPRADRQKKFF
ncbi:MAG: hypothetical protein LBR16_00780 [Treponema sp.]|jgi:hypothetical protein|nr:hypothetical protein [Treponema sp.]